MPDAPERVWLARLRPQCPWIVVTDAKSAEAARAAHWELALFERASFDPDDLSLCGVTRRELAEAERG